MLISVCKELSLNKSECNLPMCPELNDTAKSGFSLTDSKAKLVTGNYNFKVGSQLQFACQDPSEC